jgi:uncharacterized membrane protein
MENAVKNTGNHNNAAMALLVGLIIALLALSATGVQAAVIQGEVYTFDLESANGVIVEVDTVPHQQVVVRNGSYSLNVPSGSYILTATQRQKGEVIAETSENVTVAADGRYTVDLILFPLFNETDYGIDEDVPDAAVDDSTTATTIPPAQDGQSPLQLGLIIGGAVLLIILMWFLLRSRGVHGNKSGTSVHKPSTANVSDTPALIDALRKNNGRLTQKDLRRMFPHSEAKISLMLTELEHKGIIEKIRKGRSNVIILKQ